MMIKASPTLVVFSVLLSTVVLTGGPLPKQEAAPPQQNQQQEPTPQSAPRGKGEKQIPTPTLEGKPDQTAQPAPQTETQPNNAAPKPTTNSGAHNKALSHKRKKATKAQSENGKVVVRNGGAKDNSPQLSPGMTTEQALHSRESTSQLLSTTEENLKKIEGHQLSAAQQPMLEQIHTYVRESKAASASGDLTRAHTLAFKAHLLSDDLASQ